MKKSNIIPLVVLIIAGFLYYFLHDKNNKIVESSNKEMLDSLKTSIYSNLDSMSSNYEDDSLFVNLTVNDIKPDLKRLYSKEVCGGWWEAPDFPQWSYPENIPKFDFNQDISTKSLSELRLLKMEIMAINQVLIMDYQHRAYFNQFSWYRPIYWADYKPVFNNQEFNFIRKVIKRENELRSLNYRDVAGNKIANLANIVNDFQFEVLPSNLKEILNRQNFVLQQSDNAQLFAIYDQNQYEVFPSFVTTDLIVQLMHVYYTNLMKKLERGVLIDNFDRLITELFKANLENYRNKLEYKNSYLREINGYNVIYFGIAIALLQNKTPDIPSELEQVFSGEIEKIKAESGVGSTFLGCGLFDYAQFKARGHYTSSKKLKQYFKCLKWLMSAPVYLDKKNQSKAAVLNSWIILQTELPDKTKLLDLYIKINESINLFTSQEDNLSLNDIITLLQTNNYGKSVSESWIDTNLDKLLSDLIKIKKPQVKPLGVTKEAQAEFDRSAVYFSSLRYAFDAEILQRLVKNKPGETDNRLFPKSLDVFAALGNKTAENLLTVFYKEQKTIPWYLDTLNVLKQKFNNISDNIYNNRMKTLQALFTTNQSAPDFMKTDQWQKKSMQTALAGWTHLKHETILYTKQAMMAECGNGGGAPPDPNPVHYVEPNIEFWTKSLELVKSTSSKLDKLGINDDKIRFLTEHLETIITNLLSISIKELKKDHISNNEFEYLHWVGGEVEGLTNALTENLFGEEQTPDKKMPIVADVYRFNQDYLLEATGHADVLYAVVEINNKLYLTRGAVLSQYEFLSDKLLNDGEWQNLIEKGIKKAQHGWLSEIYINCQPVKVKPYFNSIFTSDCGREASQSRQYFEVYTPYNPDDNEQ